MSIERYQERSRKSYFFMTFAISLNLLIAFLIYDFIELLIASAAFFLLSFIIFLVKRNKEKRSAKRKSGLLTGKTEPSFFDGIGLSIKYFRINRKYTLASTVGLVLALLVISQTILIGSSYQQQSFNDHIKDNDTSALRFEVSSFDNQTFYDWREFFNTNYKSWFEGSDLNFEMVYTEGNVKVSVLLGRSTSESDLRAYAHTLTTYTHQWNFHVFNLLRTLPSYDGFEFNPNESVLILPPNIKFNININEFYYDIDDFVNLNDSEFRILADTDIINVGSVSELSNIRDFVNFTQTVDRIWQLTADDVSYARFNDIVLPNRFTESNLYFPVDQEWEIFEHARELVDQNPELSPYVWGTGGFSAIVKAEIPLIRDMALDELVDQMDLIEERFIHYYSLFISGEKSTSNVIPQNLPYEVSSYLRDLVKNYQRGSYNLEQSMNVSAAPLFIVSLFLLFFSLSLIEKRKERLLSQMIIRGTSIEQIRGMMIYEILISSFFASIIGMGLSIPLSSEFMKSSGILSFQADTIPLVIPYTWWWKVPILGVLLALDFNLISLFNVSRLEIEESLSASESKEAFWQKYNIDLYIFALCIIYWFIALLIPLPRNFASLLFGLPGNIALGLTIIAIPLVIGRYFINALGQVLLYFKIRFDMLGMAIKNINTNKNFTSQLIALLLTGMMLSFMALVMSNTMTIVSAERSLYNLGAEVVVEDIDYSSEAQYHALFAPGVLSVSYVRYVEYDPGTLEVPTGESPLNWPKFRFFGIDPSTFQDTAYWQESYASTSLSKLMDDLENVTSNGMLLPKNYAEAFNLTIGDLYQFRYGNRAQSIYTFQLVGIVDVFPRFIKQLPQEDNEGRYDIEDLYIITSLETMIDLMDNGDLSGKSELDQHVAYVNTADDADVTWVAGQINAGLAPLSDVYTIKDYRSEIIPFLQDINEGGDLASQENKFLSISTHTILLITILINIIGVSYYSFVFIGDRQKEIGIYRALGMTRNQILKLLFYEITLMVSTSIIFGLIGGTFLSYVSFLILIGGGFNPVPPFSLVFPVFLLIAISTLMTSLAIVLASIPAWQNSKKQTGSILRAQ